MAIEDVHGQRLTIDYNSERQIETLTDALGHAWYFTYNTDGHVIRIDDPFGRSALFEYGDDDTLTKIVDMAGYWFEFTYDKDIYLTSLTTAKGTTRFYFEPPGNTIGTESYPAPGADMVGNSRITITHPDESQEEYYYHRESGQSWHVQPNDYVPYQDSITNNFTHALKRTYSLTRAGGSRFEVSRIDYPAGGYIEYDIDSITGKRTGVRYSQGPGFEYTYNDMGRTTSKTNLNTGQTTTYVYDPGNLTDLLEVQDALGRVAYTYNTRHQVTSITDRMGKITRFIYNTLGQLETVVDAANIVTEYKYDADNYLSETKRHGQTLYQYGRDPVGRTTTTIDPTGLVLHQAYNDLNQVVTRTWPDSKTETYDYIGCCPRQLQSQTDRAGRTTSYEYDLRNNLVLVSRTDGSQIKYKYDSNRNRTKLIDTEDNETEYLYDANNRLIDIIYADGHGISYQYDSAGRLSGKTNARGITATYQYNPDYYLSGITYSDETPMVTYSYDTLNRLSKMADGSGTTLFTYDVNSRVKTIDGLWENDTITYSYNDHNLHFEITPQGGEARSFQYDPLNRLKEVTTGTQKFTYGYSGASPLIQSLTRPNGSVTNYQYDGLNRLTEVENISSAAAIINKYVYTYNDEDQRDSETITNGLAITNFQEGLVQNDYNELNQILSATTPERNFIHDADGNLTVGYTPGGYEFAAQYDAENRLKKIEYTDDQGKLHKQEYVYRGDWLLAQIKKYDDGVLVDDIRMVRDGFLVLQERDATNTIIRQYTWGQNMGGGIGGLLSLSQGGQDYFYLYDGKGNVTSVIDSSQTPAATYRYDPFGKVLAQAGTLDQPFQFSTKRYNSGTGLNYYGYRFYSPVLSRWVNRDPIGVAGGLNLYGFAQNNPVNFVDFYGLTVWKCKRPLNGKPGDWTPPVFNHQYNCITMPDGR